MNGHIILLASLSPSRARWIRKVGVYPRYWYQSASARVGYQLFHDHYPDQVIFIAGLPKSGTTWMKKMLASFPGFQEILIPQASVYELENGGSHDYALPTGFFSWLAQKLVVTKMHIPGSAHNVDILHRANQKYLIMYRDLRDVALSYYHYVRRTPWHPEFTRYKDLTLRQGLERFADTLLEPYAEWVWSWERNRDPDLSLMFSYEDLLANPGDILLQAADHFGLGADHETILRIVEQHSFQKMSGGRARGEEEPSSFFRKGVMGEWTEHFSEDLRMLYWMKAGKFFDYFGFPQE